MRIRTTQRGSWIIDGALLTAWAIMVGLVARHEHGFWSAGIRIARTIPAPLETQEQWFGLYYQGRKVGFSHLMLIPDEQQGIPGVAIVDHGYVSISLLGVPQTIQVNSRAFVDADRRLQQVTALVSTTQYSLRLVGQREGDSLVLTISNQPVGGSPGGSQPPSTMTQRIADPSDRLWVSGLSSWAAFNRLEVGQWGQMWIVNPLALKPEPVYFHVSRREQVDGRETLVVESDYHGLTATTWITPEGHVLREASPMGWELVQETQQQALAMGTATAEPVDLLSTVAVTVDRPIRNPAGLTRLTLLLEGVASDAITVDRAPWQTVLPEANLQEYGQSAPEGAWCLLELATPTFAHSAIDQPAVPVRYTSASFTVQSNDPLIQRQAATVAAERGDPLAQTLAIQEWVHRTLTKQLTVGLPTARDVLLTKVGDCHEHTVLFTALARSLGIPTRMIAGLVSYRERFYYHAWPEVRLQGRWVPLDPTLGQAPADLTHIGFVEAENEDLVGLARIVGRIRLRVLAQH